MKIDGRFRHFPYILIKYNIRNIIKLLRYSSNGMEVFVFENENYVIYKRQLFLNTRLILEVKDKNWYVYDIHSNFIKKKLKYIQLNFITRNSKMEISLQHLYPYVVNTSITQLSTNNMNKLVKASIELI